MVSRLVILCSLSACIYPPLAQALVSRDAYSISISKTASEVGLKLHCTLEGGNAFLYDLKFYEDSVKTHAIDGTHISSNGQGKSAWLALTHVTNMTYGVYKCCADHKIRDNSEKICSESVYHLPPDSSEDILTRHFVPHGQAASLKECEDGHRYVLYLQDRQMDILKRNLTNLSSTSNSENHGLSPNRIVLTQLNQQAKYTCIGDNGRVLHIEYVLADYTPIQYIWPTKNGTILPPQASGLPLTVDCRARGAPTPNVYWYDDWYEYSDDYEWRKRTLLEDGMRLYIEHLQNHIFENYWIWCIAENVWEKHVRWVKYPDPTPYERKPIDTSQFHFAITPQVAEVGQTVTFDASIGVNGSPFHGFPVLHHSSSIIPIVQIDKGKYRGEKVATLEDGGIWNCTVWPYNHTVYRSEIQLYVSEDLLSLRYSDDSLVVDVNSSSTYKTSIVLHVDFYTVDPTKLNISTSVSGPAGYFLKKSKIGPMFYDEDSSTLVYAVTWEYHDHGGNQSVADALSDSNLTGSIHWHVQYWAKSIIHTIPVIIMKERASPPDHTMPVDTSLFHFSVTPSVAEVGQTVTFDATIGPKLSHFLHTPTWSRSPSSIEMVHIGMGKYFGTKVVTLADGGTWNCTVYPYNESVYMAEVPLYVSKDLVRLRYSDDSLVVDVNSSSTYKTSIVLHVDFYTVDPTKLNVSTSVSGPAGYFLKKSKIGPMFYDEDSSTLVYAVTWEYHDHGGNQSVALSNITGSIQWHVQYWAKSIIHTIPVIIMKERVSPPDHAYSISISKNVSEVGLELYCTLEGKDDVLYDLNFYEDSAKTHPIDGTLFRSNGHGKSVWLALTHVTNMTYGVYKCCANHKIRDNSEKICSESIYHLPPDSSENILIRHYVPHGQAISLKACENGHRYVLYLQDRHIQKLENNLTNLISTNNSENHGLSPNRIVLTQLNQQAKYTCIGDNGRVLHIEYVLADYTPIQYIWPTKNGTVLPPQASGLPLTVDCRARGAPTPNVYWYDDWYEYSDDDNRRKRTLLEDGMRLHIAHLQNHLFENYWIWCIAENVWEKHVRWVKYPDPTPPKRKPVDTSQFRFAITPQVVEVGQTITFYANIGVNGSPLISFPLLHHPSKFPIVHIGKGEYSGEKVATLEDGGIWNCSVALYDHTVYRSEIQLYVSEDLLSLNYSDDSIVIDVNSSSTYKTSIVLNVDFYTVDPTKLNISTSVSGPAGYFLELFKNESIFFNNSTSELTYSMYVTYYENSDKDSLLLQGGNLTGLIHWKVNYWEKNISHATPILVLLPNEVHTPVRAPTNFLALLVVPAILVVVVLLMLGIVYYLCRRGDKLQKQREFYSTLTPPQRLLQDLVDQLEQTSLLHNMDSLQFETDILGEGAFGVVKKATLTHDGSQMVVAVKSLKGAVDEGNLHDFLKEFWTLHNIGHHANIINLIGVAVDIHECCLNIIVEFASKGNLLRYLRKKRAQGELLSWRDRLDFAVQIARGMTYLESKQCIHCDLAARNVLLTSEGVLKVSDFGLARKSYYEFYLKKITPKTRLPLKWMALESLEAQIFTSKGDVWSFGVLLWEIATLGGSPYPAMPISDLLPSLKNGYRMSKPSGCPMNIYTIMRSCWLPEPHQRPTFNQLVAMLDLLLEDLETFAECDDMLDGDVSIQYDDSLSTASTISGGDVDYTGGEFGELHNSYVNRVDRTWHSSSEEVTVQYQNGPVCESGSSTVSLSNHSDVCVYCKGRTSDIGPMSPSYQNVVPVVCTRDGCHSDDSVPRIFSAIDNDGQICTNSCARLDSRNGSVSPSGSYL